MNTQYDLIIVGGGIVGASLALAVAASNGGQKLSVAVIEAHTELRRYRGDEFDPRVVALSQRSQALFDELGLWSTIVADRVCPYRTMDVWDAEGTGQIAFDCNDLHLSELGHIVENSVLVSALRDTLSALPQIHFISGCKVRDLALPEQSAALTRLTLTDEREISASLVVAADGALSSLREKAGFSTREWSYGHTAIVTTVKTEKPHGFRARQRFTVDGPLAFLPLSRQGEDDHYCSIVWSITSSLSQTILEQDDAFFCHQLSRAFEYRLGKVVAAGERVGVPLTQRHSREYWKPGLALTGDAAHTIHPLAGQGVNLGLYDISVLSEEINRACERGINLADVSILQRYERRRQRHNLLAMATMEGFKRMFGSEQPALRWMRNQGMSWIDAVPILKRRLANIAAGNH